MATKERADQLVFERGLADSRESAKRLIMAGKVWWRPAAEAAWQRLDKAGHKLSCESDLELSGCERFVSRGAYKLLTALERWPLPVDGAVALDAGASTGGFTDCLLQHGAARVYAVDVGHGQLHERLRADPRVVNMERTNLRHAAPDLLPEQVDLLVADVSFISLPLVLEPCLRFCKPGAWVAALIKPQFELGPQAAKGGVVKDEALRQEAVDKVLAWARSACLELQGVAPAAVKGPKGNQEYMAVWRLPEQAADRQGMGIP